MSAPQAPANYSFYGDATEEISFENEKRPNEFSTGAFQTADELFGVPPAAMDPASALAPPAEMASCDVPPGARSYTGPTVPQNVLGNAEWVDERYISNCMRCSEEFSTFLRKHHCRQCGQVFCYRCCSSKALLQLGSGTDPAKRAPAHPILGMNETDPRKPQRVCGRCFDLLLPLQASIAATTSKAQQAPDFEEACVAEWLGKPVSRSFKLEIKKAVHNLRSFLGMPDDEMVRNLISSAHGVVLLSIVKVGFLGAVQGGAGLVLSRNVDTGIWSAPCAIGVGGLSIGAQVGGELNTVLLILRNEEAVRAFASTSKMTLGLNMSVAVGPIGRTASAEGVAAMTEDMAHAACYSYSVSRGAFAGVALDGLFCFTRDRLNHTFYGHPASAKQLLSGKIAPPPAAEPLYRELRTHTVEYAP